jgi:hypothetical protein
MTSSDKPSSHLDAVEMAWRERRRAQAELRLAERALGRAALAAARADTIALMRLPVAVIGDPVVRGALDAARMNPAPPHLFEGRWELDDVIDLYAAGRLDRAGTVKILAGWPYQAPRPSGDEAQPWGDSFAVVDAAGYTGLLPRDLVDEIRQFRHGRQG